MTKYRFDDAYRTIHYCIITVFIIRYTPPSYIVINTYLCTHPSSTAGPVGMAAH